MPTTPKRRKKRRPLNPQRHDAIPPLKGVKFEDAMRAAMETPLPKGWKPPKGEKAREEE